MPITRLELRLRCREKIRALVEEIPLVAEVSDKTTTSVTIAIADTDRLQPGFEIEIGQGTSASEIMLLRSVNPDTGVLSVFRAWRGSTAAIHTLPGTVRIYPEFSNRQINQWIDRAIRNLWPEFFIEKNEDVFKFITDQFEYDLPDDLGQFIGISARHQAREPLKLLRDWNIIAKQILFPRTSTVLRFNNQNAKIHYLAKPKPFERDATIARDGKLIVHEGDTLRLSSLDILISSDNFGGTTGFIAIPRGDSRGSFKVSAWESQNTLYIDKDSTFNAETAKALSLPIEFAVCTDEGEETDGVINADLVFSSVASTFTSDDVGNFIVITSSADVANEKTWKIVGFLDDSNLILENTSIPVPDTGITFRKLKPRSESGDSAEIHDDLWVEGILYWVAAEAIEEIKTIRSLFTGFSAILNDRASKPDELTRDAFYWKNQFRIFKENQGRDFPNYIMPWPTR